MSIANVNGIDINYDLAGDHGPVLVFANSLGTDLVMWEQQAEAFRKGFRVLRFDMRGHGASGSPPGPYTIELLGRDVLALTEYLGFHKFSFCGLSLGGMVGQWLGIHAGNKLDKLILVATTSSFLSSDFPARIEAIHEHGLGEVVDDIVSRWFTQQFQEEAPHQVSRIRNMTISASEEGYVACCEAMVTGDFINVLEQIKTPTLCIVGADDMATNLATVTLLAAGIPGAKLEVIVNGAHLINVERPEEFNRILRGFLEG